jgi:phosphatidylglycerol:prolipoprotein diacylglycerol transferase
MSIDELGIHLGPLYFHFYGMALLAGMLAGAALTAYRAKRHGQDPDHVWNGLLLVILTGLVGARIYHILTPPPSMGITTLDYLKNPLKAIDTRLGGLGVPGGLIGGGLAVFFYARRHKLDFFTWADLLIPGVALGQAIGRWGNYFNQELYGKPTDLPWAITIRDENRLPHYTEFSRFHPMFLYEMIWTLLICVGLIWVGRRFADRLRSGDLLALYTILYPGGRFFLEFLKLDAPALGHGLTIAQIVSLLAAVVGLALLVARHRLASRQSSTVPPPSML